MKIYGILKKRAKWLTTVIFIAAAYMVILEIRTHQWGYIPLTILVMVACFFDKEQIISEEGVDIEYHLFNKYIKHNYWRWDEITTLHTDYSKAAPKVMLHIGKDITTRSFVMEKDDCQEAIKLARRMNSGIYIENLTEEEQREREEAIRMRQRARKQKNKRKK